MDFQKKITYPENESYKEVLTTSQKSKLDKNESSDGRTYFAQAFSAIVGSSTENLVKVFPASVKLINPIENYLHIMESYACILKIFVFMFLLPINVLNSSGICSNPKESK